MQLSHDEFNKYRKQFSLGNLQTEGFHPLSQNLSEVLTKSTTEAIDILQAIDKLAIEKILDYSKTIFKIQKDCEETLRSGGKIFLCGCGATGRLALSLEKIYRDNFHKDNVIAFMAGGDYALIKSVESFEDNAGYGERQLDELGFDKNDLLISITEGGETSFVIGATNSAQKRSHRKPWFIYCNPDSQLKKIERSWDVICNNDIQKLTLDIGAMAISGSTRMQASTVQMIVGGFALLKSHDCEENLLKDLRLFSEQLIKEDISWLASFIDKEAETYFDKKIVTYKSPAQLAICVLTDTTERAPTFNLQSFEKESDDYLSWSFLCVLGVEDNIQAWSSMLGRKPRAINWPEHNGEINIDKIFEFDLTQKSLERRSKHIKGMEVFKIDSDGSRLFFEFAGVEKSVSLNSDDLFYKHILLKMILNIHSTLVMGKLGRFRGNMMSYVKASNAKLVDRAYRYIKRLLEIEKVDVLDDEIISLIFKYRTAVLEEGIVNKVFNELISKEGS